MNVTKFMNPALRPFVYAWRVAVSAGMFAAFGIGALGLSLLVLPPLCTLFAARNPERSRVLAQTCIGACFRFFIRMWRAFGMINYRIENAAALREDAGCVIVANHPSLIDTVFIASLLPRCDCIVKETLWDNPFLRGIVRRAGYIPNHDAENLIELCRTRLAAGSCILVFPEGTRTRPGQPLVLQRGAANIAVRCRAPVRVVRIFCDPPFLTKGEKWWFGTPRRPQFVIRIGEKLLPPHGNPGDSDGAAARRLTDLLATKLASTQPLANNTPRTPISMNNLQDDLKQLIIQTCRLEGIASADIDASQPIFGAGLGLDSIDSLELGLAVKSRYNIPPEAVEGDMREHFASVATLEKFVAANRRDNPSDATK